jgi:single-strand DNA-binding protein
MYQKIILIGNLGGDPELRHTGDQTAVCNFSIADSRRVKSENGWENKTQWWRVSLFGKRAETANQYLSKGAKVLVEGEISFDYATGGP